MRKFLKIIAPKMAVKAVKKYIVNRFLTNIFNSSHSKRVLISYITRPFAKKSFSHSNYYEVAAAANVFDELGYIVDVMHFEGDIPDLKRYDVIYGFGDVFQKYFEGGMGNIKTIYYGAGMHVCHQNTKTLKRVKDVYKKKGAWIADSARFVEKTWTHQTSLVDGIIALGNSECAKTYRKYYGGKTLSLDAPYFQTVDAESVIASRDANANKSYLWFGSAGLIHKGLDLCLDFFKTRPDLTLHVCGHIHSETKFVNAYHYELFALKNIVVHGFINIQSNEFIKVLKSCSFVIFPSCSEGGGVSVLTAVGNGALIPIITKESSVSTGCEIWIEDFTFDAMAKAIEDSQSLSAAEIYQLQLSNLNYVRDRNSQSEYYKNLKFAIRDILS